MYTARRIGDILEPRLIPQDRTGMEKPRLREKNRFRRFA
jgi:hypothetical protein